MSDGGVRVESIDALRFFRVALIKFKEAASTALCDAESDMQDMLKWLEGEQMVHWKTQIRKRHDVLEKAKEQLRMKRLFRDAAGRIPYAIEEEKAVRLAQVRIEEAEEKLAAVKKYARVLRRELDAYKGAAQRLDTTLVAQLPIAIALLDGYVKTLEEYVMLAPDGVPITPPPKIDELPT